MSPSREQRKTCSRGHVFRKSSERPVCPKCWPRYYETITGDFARFSAPALRALTNARIKKLKSLTKCTAAEILQLHGVGPSSMLKLRQAMKAKGFSFKKDPK